MKQTGGSTLLVLAMLLAACGSSAPAPATPSPAPSSGLPASAAASTDSVIATAKIVPARASNMGFTISGLVKEITVGEGDLVQAGQSLVVLNTPELDYAVLAAAQSLRAAQADLATRNRDKYKYVDGYDRVFYYAVPNEVAQIERAKVQRAQAQLDLAQASLAQGILLAPFDGTVASIDITPGEEVQPDQLILTVADLTALQVETTDLSERDIALIKVGQAVDIYVAALDAHAGGTVVLISPISEVLGGDIVYRVTIQPREMPEGLRWGMTAEVEIQTK